MVEKAAQSREPRGFSARLRHVVQEFGSTNAFASSIGRSEGGVRNWLRGESEPNVTDLVKICELTGTSIEWLVLDRGPIKVADVARESAARYGKSGVDPALLRAVLEIVDEEVDNANAELAPAKRADLVVTVYDLSLPQRTVDRATVTRLVRLAA